MAKSAQALWHSLEVAYELPPVTELHHLSGLLDPDIRRFRAAWPHLPVDARRQLATTLAQMAEADFEMDFSAIFHITLHDPDAEVRATSIGGLFEQEDTRLVPRFVALLQDDESEPVRIKAAEALGNFVLLGELQKIRARPFDQARAALHAVHTNPAESLELRRRALESLAYTALDDVSELIDTAYRHPNEKMRISAVFAMGRSADSRWADTVLRELLNIEPEMRFEATRACGELMMRQAVPALIELAEDADTEIREMALWSLGQAGGDRARRALTRYARSRDEALRIAAEAALQELDFFHGDLDTFFGPPEMFDGSSDMAWDEDEV